MKFNPNLWLINLGIWICGLVINLIQQEWTDALLFFALSYTTFILWLEARSK